MSGMRKASGLTPVGLRAGDARRKAYTARRQDARQPSGRWQRARSTLRATILQYDYWHGDREVGGHVVPGRLGGYYTDLSAKARVPPVMRTDELGVPTVYAGPRAGHVTHPVTVSQVALGCYELWLSSGDDAHRQRFLRLADWLLDTGQESEGGTVWPVPLYCHLYHLPAGWLSALVQGQATSVLVRAYHESQCERYLDAARGALQPFDRDAAHGGVANRMNGHTVFEECPTWPPSAILNGFVSSLLGLYDFAICTGEARVGHLYATGLRGLMALLPRYDVGFWSRYCLYPFRLPNVANPYYHREHIAQMRALHVLTGHEVFADYARRWQRYYARRLYQVGALSAKVIIRIGRGLEDGRRTVVSGLRGA